jgi:hypoxanthine phosphoribosyltransferase
VDQLTPAVTGRRRIFDHRRIWLLGQNVFTAAADLIAEQEAPYRPQAVVGIARGGLPLARHVAGRLGVEMVEVAARHNATDTAYLPATGRVELPGPNPHLPPTGSPLLVVDDICGTGATLAAVTALLTEQCAPASVRTAVLCRNEATDDCPNRPDVWVWRLRDWVVFPWEQLPPGRDEPTEALAVPDRLSMKEAS